MAGGEETRGLAEARRWLVCLLLTAPAALPNSNFGTEMSDEFDIMVPLGQEEKKVITKAGSCKGSRGEGRTIFIGNRKVRLLTLHCILWA